MWQTASTWWTYENVDPRYSQGFTNSHLTSSRRLARNEIRVLRCHLISFSQLAKQNANTTFLDYGWYFAITHRQPRLWRIAQHSSFYIFYCHPSPPLHASFRFYEPSSRFEWQSGHLKYSSRWCNQLGKSEHPVLRRLLIPKVLAADWCLDKANDASRSPKSIYVLTIKIASFWDAFGGLGQAFRCIYATVTCALISYILVKLK